MDTTKLQINISTERIRQLMSHKGNVSQATTPEAQAFLLLHGSALVDRIEAELVGFVTRKMAV